MKEDPCEGCDAKEVKLLKDLGMRLPLYDSKYPRRYGLFLCPYCGNTFTRQIYDFKSRGIKSCGCVIGSYKHGLSNHPLHKIWRLLKNRCHNKNAPDYRYYGGRGIFVCNEWLNDFMPFYEWAIHNGYDSKLEIDRIDNNSGYSPHNCRWATHSENVLNARHLRSNNTSGYKGVSSSGSQSNPWVARCNFNKKTYNIGQFKTKDEAAVAYNNFVVDHYIKTSLNII